MEDGFSQIGSHMNTNKPTEIIRLAILTLFSSRGVAGGIDPIELAAHVPGPVVCNVAHVIRELILYVTGFEKTRLPRTKIKIYFIGPMYSYTQELPIHHISCGKAEVVCFSGG